MLTDRVSGRGLRGSVPNYLHRVNDGLGSEVTYLSLSDVARLLPTSRSGRPVHVATLTRWIVDGVRLRDGTRLHLRGTRLPGRWVVEPAALEEFLAALTVDRAGRSPPAPPGPGRGRARTPSARRKADERAARELDDAGIR
jgi:hypothetical protein